MVGILESLAFFFSVLSPASPFSFPLSLSRFIVPCCLLLEVFVLTPLFLLLACCLLDDTSFRSNDMIVCYLYLSLSYLYPTYPPTHTPHVRPTPY